MSHYRTCLHIPPQRSFPHISGYLLLTASITQTWTALRACTLPTALPSPPRPFYRPRKTNTCCHHVPQARGRSSSLLWSCARISESTPYSSRISSFSAVYSRIFRSRLQRHTPRPTRAGYWRGHTEERMSVECRCVTLLPISVSDLSLTETQSFHTPTTLRDFYRYIRIDFHSHYGHEYYCPISLLRVYGLTHLEQYKWDIWEAESRTRSHAQVEGFSSVTEPLPTSSGASEPNKSMDKPQAQDIPTPYFLDTTPPIATIHPPAHTGLDKSPATNAENQMSSSTSSSEINKHYSASSSPVVTPQVTESTSTQQPITSISSPPDLRETRATSSFDSTISPIVSVLSKESPSTHPHLTPSEVPYTSNIQVTLSQSSSLSHHTTATNAVSTAHPSFPNIPPVGSSGESIYRTIMTRLTILEANHSLHARYVEEQTAGVREVLRRLGEDIGRLESNVSPR